MHAGSPSSDPAAGGDPSPSDLVLVAAHDEEAARLQGHDEDESLADGGVAGEVRARTCL